MENAITIIGTPDGFDFQTQGARTLSGLDIAKKFDGIGFSRCDFPLRSSVWGVFKKQTGSEIVIGVCILERVYENTGNRSGGYCGVGYILCNATAIKKFSAL